MPVAMLSIPKTKPQLATTFMVPPRNSSHSWIVVLRCRGRSRRSLATLEPFRHGGVEFRTRHLQLIGMRIDIFGETLIFLRSPTALKFGAVLAFFVEFEVVVIFQTREFRVADCVLSQDGRDKDHPVGFREDYIPR